MADQRPKTKTLSDKRVTSGRPEAVRIRLLGDFSVSVGSRTIEQNQWRLRKAAALVKVLALAPGHHLHREQAIDLLWPDLGTKAASNNLRQALHAVRRALDPERGSLYLASHDESLVLCPRGNLWVDVEAFEEAAVGARRARDRAVYRVAIDLYAGELLPEDRYEEWAEGRREELRRLHLALLVELAGLYEERGQYGLAIEALRKAVAEEPTFEEAHSGLMRLYTISHQSRAALTQYERLREIISRELGTEPGETTQRLREDIAAGTFSPDQPQGGAAEESLGIGKHNLPAARTSFVGREQVIVEIKRELAMTRLLTLTGAGGSGKTRLAIEVARELVGTYPEGVWLVELAGLSEGTLVTQAVAAALSVQEQPDRPLIDTLVDFLREKKMLMVLDNCEHLIEAAARLTDTLLDSCPRLTVLATSREALAVGGEILWQVMPLSLPATTDGGSIGERNGTYSVEGLMRYEAVRLFVDRARLRLPSFQLTQENAGAVARVCRGLDGIPLAIELATARMGALAVEQVAQRLESSLDVLRGASRTAAPRQQTLRATLDWSHDLLSEVERRFFRRLSVFAGGWTLEAAEAVSSAEGIEKDDGMDLLGGLVDKSLVVAGSSMSGAVRYRMLEPIRQYALEKLEESSEAERVRGRHAGHYLALAETAEPELLGTDQASWLGRLEIEHANLRAALSWALDPKGDQPEQRAESGLRLAAALGRFWYAHGPSEGLRWLERGLARGGASPKSVRAKALGQAGYLAAWQGDYEEAVAMLEEGLASFKSFEDKSSVPTLLADLGVTMVHRCDHERVRALRQEAEALRPGLSDRRAIAGLLIFLGMAAMDEGDRDRAVAHFEESLTLCRELGDRRGIAVALTSLGMTKLSQGDLERAAASLEEVLRILQGRGDKVAISYSLLGLAGVAASRGHLARAARLWGASEALREAAGFPLSPFTLSNYDYEGYLAAARAGLDEQSFTAAWAAGREMTPEQATEYALSEVERPSPLVPMLEEPSAAQPPVALTRRERQVASMVAQGLTNRQIASELFISERTVDHHVEKILRKLDLSSREQVASRLVE